MFFYAKTVLQPRYRCYVVPSCPNNFGIKIPLILPSLGLKKKCNWVHQIAWKKEGFHRISFQKQGKCLFCSMKMSKFFIFTMVEMNSFSILWQQQHVWGNRKSWLVQGNAQNLPLSSISKQAQFKHYLRDQTVLLPKRSPHQRIILAKGQFDHLYIF